MAPFEYRARTKAGRAWIAAILDAATTIRRIEIDNVTNDHRAANAIDVALLRQFIETDGRTAVLYEISDNEFVYLSGGATERYVTKYVVRTYAFDASDLPAIKEKP
jgi:hypothetical protein